jgi:hypothetical protein
MVADLNLLHDVFRFKKEAIDRNHGVGFGFIGAPWSGSGKAAAWFPMSIWSAARML